MRIKTKLHKLLDDPKAKGFPIINDVLALATIVSVLALILETVESLAPYHDILKTIELVTVALFTAEYFARVYAAKSRARYIFSFYGMIDLIAILPTFIGLANLTFLKATRALRILRFLRILRLAKLARVKRDGTQSIYILNIQIYLTALVTALLVMGSLFYIIEHGHAYAKDIPSAMYWVFLIILGGIPYEQPHTTLGHIVLIATRFLSLILLGLVVSLTATMVRKALIGSEKDAE